LTTDERKSVAAEGMVPIPNPATLSDGTTLLPLYWL
jgi:hypothetical protein